MVQDHSLVSQSPTIAPTVFPLFFQSCSISPISTSIPSMSFFDVNYSMFMSLTWTKSPPILKQL